MQHSFFNYVERQYGRETLTLMKKGLQLKIKLARLKTQHEFLLKCNRVKLLPYSLRHDFRRETQGLNPEMSKKFINKSREFLLKLRIKNSITYIKHISNCRDSTYEALECKLPEDIFEDFVEHSDNVYDKVFRDSSGDLSEKFTAMCQSEKELHKKRMEHNGKWLHNLTDVPIPQNVQSVLSLGEKFSVKQEPDNKTLIDTVASIESALNSQESPAVNRTHIRNQVVNILANHKRAPKSTTYGENLLKSDIQETTKFIKDNPHLMISRADKGSVTVIATRTEYDEKMKGLLNDTTTYQKVTSSNNISTSLTKKVNKFVKDLESKEYMDTYEAKKLRNSNSVLPRIYGLFKIHKPESPLRPIVSCINSAMYDIAKYFVGILNNVIGKKNSHLKNSTEFKDKIFGTRIPRNHILYSLDVKSLFTNIPSELVEEVIMERWNEIRKHTVLPLTTFVDGIKLILENCYFTYQNQTYKQIFGSPMGSPVSPALAELVLEWLEDKVLNNLKVKGINVPFYFRYVDDCLLTTSGRYTDRVLKEFNSIHDRIQFTIEVEKDGEIAFLENRLVRQPDGTIFPDWYHKDTWSGRYCNYLSYLPHQYKLNTISMLTRRAILLSHESFLEKNFMLIKKVLHDNNYPPNLVDKIMESTIEKVLFPKPPTPTPTPMLDTPPKYLSIPYDGVTYGKIKALMLPLNIMVIGRPQKTLGSLTYTKLKDNIDKKFLSNVVYKMECTECQSQYIGQTRQHLFARFQQHRNGKEDHSALSQHLHEEGHTISFDNVTVLCTEMNQKKRDVKEMIHIRNSTCINSHTDTSFLPKCYDNVLFGDPHT